jgi:hypothetical protein
LRTNALIRWQRRVLNAFGFTLAFVQPPGDGSIILMTGYEFGVMLPDSFRAECAAILSPGHPVRLCFADWGHAIDNAAGMLKCISVPL